MQRFEKHENNGLKSPRRTARWIIGILVMALVIVGLPNVTAASRDRALVTLPTSDSSKREVVYARLSTTGAVDQVYVVNHFDPKHEVDLKDYGDYEEVVQLTGDTAPVLNDGVVTMEGIDGPYYYQGTLKTTDLPWTIEFTYRLDGEDVEPSELSGATGHLAMELAIGKNENVHADFFDNYALQVTIPVDPERMDIVAISEGIMLAHVGSEQQLTYMGLPGTEEKVTIIMEVKDFAMAPITIAGIPLAIDVDLSNLEGELEPLDELSGAIAEFADGALALKRGYARVLDAYNNLRDGGSELADGGRQLAGGMDELMAGLGAYTDGVGQYTDGVARISKNYQAFDDGIGQMRDGAHALVEQGAALKHASQDILDGLNEIVDALPDSEKVAELEIPAWVNEKVADLAKLLSASEQFRDALKAMAGPDGGAAQLAAGLDQLLVRLQGLKQQANAFPKPAAPIEPMTAEMWQAYVTQQLGLTISGAPETEAAFYRQLAEMSQAAAGYAQAVTMLHDVLDALLAEDGVPALAAGAHALADGIHELEMAYNGTTLPDGTYQPGIHDGIAQLVGELQLAAAFLPAVEPIKAQVVELIAGLEQLRDGYAGVYDEDGRPVLSDPDDPDSPRMVGFHPGLVAYVDRGVGGLAAGFDGEQGLVAGSAKLRQGLQYMANQGRGLRQGGQDVSGGLAQAGDGIDDYLAGVETFTTGLDQYRRQGLLPYARGLNQFADGAAMFRNETGDLRERLQQAIEEKIDAFSGNDYEVQSFVSSRNRDVASVQFIMMTEEIPVADD